MWINKIPLCALALFISCSSGEKPEFSQWYKNNKDSAPNAEQPIVSQASFYSSPLRIDTIYRSMQGPYEVKEISIDSEGDDLIWLTGYGGKIEMIEKDPKTLSDKFMCHNNLNLSEKDEIPWKVKTKGDNSRIFTLSGGQTDFKFPQGFGIPAPADQSFDLVSQVLNHHDENIDIQTKHHINIKYIKDSQLDSPLTPLYQQAVFVTKQISGPAGEYGLPQLCVEHHLDSNQIKGMEPKHDCSVNIDEEDYNPYRDAQGRRYTGHWILPFGKETLTTDVTKMMDLEENSRIHAIGVHLHPFAEGFELWDKTSDSLLFATKLKAKPNGFGFEDISYYSSQKGIAVYKDHQYELKSTYNCTDSTEQHTAMATMFLYIADQ